MDHLTTPRVLQASRELARVRRQRVRRLDETSVKVTQVTLADALISGTIQALLEDRQGCGGKTKPS